MSRTRRPYQLPKKLTCRQAEVANGVSIQLVKKYIAKHEKGFPRYTYLENLFEGFHDILIKPEKPEWKPDHRLIVNYPWEMTNTFIGYGYGNGIRVSGEDNVYESIDDFYRVNSMDEEDADLVEKCCIYGHAWEYFYQDENTNTRTVALSPKELFTVYDGSLKGKALFGVRYGYYEDENGSKKIEGEILTRTTIERFVDDKKVEILDNPYGLIPVVEWKLNEHKIGLYEPVANLIEEFNYVISEKGNDIDAFAEAYMKILGAEVDEEGVHRIRDDRLINFFGTDNANDIVVDFMTKPSADGTQENLLERLERLIYKISMIANISDESFGSATSGEALAYKLHAMSNLANAFDRKIKKSIQKRFKIFFSLSTNGPDPEAWKDIDITMSRNVPKNIKEEAEIAKSLEGIASKETQLKTLSIVDDVKAEIDRIEEENSVPQFNETAFGDE